MEAMGNRSNLQANYVTRPVQFHGIVLDFLGQLTTVSKPENQDFKFCMFLFYHENAYLDTNSLLLHMPFTMILIQR